jgi:hypothetical protein
MPLGLLRLRVLDAILFCGGAALAERCTFVVVDVVTNSTVAGSAACACQCWNGWCHFDVVVRSGLDVLLRIALVCTEIMEVIL